MYLIRHRNLKTVRIEVRSGCNDNYTNLADTTQLDNSSSEPVTARNIGCLDPFSDLYVKVISFCSPYVVHVQCDVRYHRIFGVLHGCCHGRETARMGFPRSWVYKVQLARPSGHG